MPARLHFRVSVASELQEVQAEGLTVCSLRVINTDREMQNMMMVVMMTTCDGGDANDDYVELQ